MPKFGNKVWEIRLLLHVLAYKFECNTLYICYSYIWDSSTCNVVRPRDASKCTIQCLKHSSVVAYLINMVLRALDSGTIVNT